MSNQLTYLQNMKKITMQWQYHVFIFLLPFLELFIVYLTDGMNSIAISQFLKLIQLISIFSFVILNHEKSPDILLVIVLVVLYTSCAYFYRTDFLKDINSMNVKDSIVYITYPFYFYYFYFLQKEINHIIDKMTLAFIFLSVSLSIINVLMNFRDFHHLWSVDNPYLINFRSLFENRNQFAQLLFISIIVTIETNFLSVKQKNTVAIFLALNLFATLSRTAIGSLLLYFFIKHVILPALKSNSDKNKLINLVVLILFGLLLALALGNFGFFAKVMRLEFGLSGRPQLWALGWKIFKENWLFGMGLSNARKLIEYNGIYNNQFHNLYIENLASYGILGTLLSLYFVKKLLSNLRKENKQLCSEFLYLPFLVTMAYGLVESVSFFKIGLSSMVFSYFSFLYPLLSNRNTSCRL